MIATAIITAPRPRATLAASLVSFYKAGFAGYVLVSADGEPPAINPTSVSTITVNRPALGNLRNWASALVTIYERTTAEWLMVCEDDITWAEGAADALQLDLESLRTSSHFRSIGAMSLYFPIHESRDVEAVKGPILGPGWHAGARRGMRTWGAQSIVFSREMARALLADKQLSEFIASKKYTKNVDAIIAKCINDQNKDIYYRVPCLVDHSLGYANSSLGYEEERRQSLKTRYFTGQA